jgi:hypothetical protein
MIINAGKLEGIDVTKEQFQAKSNDLAETIIGRVLNGGDPLKSDYKGFPTTPSMLTDDIQSASDQFHLPSYSWPGTGPISRFLLGDGNLSAIDTPGEFFRWLVDVEGSLLKVKLGIDLFELGRFLAMNMPPFYDIEQWVNDFFNAAFGFTQPRRDPLTLDLDGDGLETVGTTAGILFDHNADGIKTGTGWVIADDGFLVLDKNDNRVIDNGRELFGDNFIKANGQLAADGFDSLRSLDRNANGKIDAGDAQFGSLKVWRDLNQNGTTQSGELFTLSQLGIATINTGSTANSQVLPNGNQIADMGTYTKTDGTTGSTVEVTGNLADINLGTDSFHRVFTDHLDTSGVANLPDMLGSGAVREAANDCLWRMVA